MINSFETLYYTLAFIVPGFVLSWVYASLVPQKTEIQFSVFRFLFYSCINYAVWSWLIYLMISNSDTIPHPFVRAWLWTVIILVSPVLLGVAGGLLRKKGYVRRALQKIGLTPIHVIPTAWDYKFSQLVEPTWILVTLKDGSYVGGLFGEQSFTSSDSAERDIYLEEVYTINENGPWTSIERGNGILILGEQIRHIEFWHNEIPKPESNIPSYAFEMNEKHSDNEEPKKTGSQGYQPKTYNRKQRDQGPATGHRPPSGGSNVKPSREK